MSFDDDDLPSLDDIFNKTESVKRVKVDSEEEEKENVKKTVSQTPSQSKTNKSMKLEEHFDALKVNTPVFVADLYEHEIVPGIVVEEESDSYYKIKYFDGRIETIGRRFIYCTTDSQFYSITPVPLKDVLNSKNVMIRPFVKEKILNLIKAEEDALIKILKGEIESERDETFRSGKRFSCNSENSPGPFTLEEYNFLLEYFPDILIPKLLESDPKLGPFLEKRFDKTGKNLNHLLRQYSYLVLVPEFIIRHILKLDSSIKTVEEANNKLLNDSTAFDQETGNFINYLYSKQDMYRYARRQNTKTMESIEDED